MTNVEQPMGNTEMRLLFATIQEEIGDVKGIALDTKDQAMHTNGTVKWHTKCLYLALGALPLLTFWAAGLTYYVFDNKSNGSQLNQGQVQAAVVAGIDEAIANKSD